MPRRKKFKWTLHLEEKLIDYFERNSILYDTNKLYKNKPHKTDVFKKIGKRLDVECKIHLLSLTMHMFNVTVIIHLNLPQKPARGRHT